MKKFLIASALGLLATTALAENWTFVEQLENGDKIYIGESTRTINEYNQEKEAWFKTVFAKPDTISTKKKVKISIDQMRATCTNARIKYQHTAEFNTDGTNYIQDLSDNDFEPVIPYTDLDAMYSSMCQVPRVNNWAKLGDMKAGPSESTSINLSLYYTHSRDTTGGKPKLWVSYVLPIPMTIPKSKKKVTGIIQKEEFDCYERKIKTLYRETSFDRGDIETKDISRGELKNEWRTIVPDTSGDKLLKNACVQ